MSNDKIKEEEKNRNFAKVLSIVLVLIVVIVGVSYAYWTTTKTQEDENILTTTCLEIVYEDINHGILYEHAYPISDEEGRNSEYKYRFKVTNKCDTNVDYDVNLDSISIRDAKLLSLNQLTAILNDSDTKKISEYPTTTSVLDSRRGSSYDTRKLESNTLTPAGTENDSKTYSLRIWLDKYAPESEMGAKHKSIITVNGKNTNAG